LDDFVGTEEGIKGLSTGSVLTLTSASGLDLSGRTELTSTFFIGLGYTLQQPSEPAFLFLLFRRCYVVALYQRTILFTRHFFSYPLGGYVPSHYFLSSQNTFAGLTCQQHSLLFPLTTMCYRTTHDDGHADKDLMADLLWESENIEVKPQSH
jgi:hypothetical protein